MSTNLLYLQDSYQKSAAAKVLEVGEVGGQDFVVLDQTIFYAQGGGQPADHGTITGPNGKLVVSHVSYNSGNVQHKGHIEGSVAVGDAVELSIDWDLRYSHMQMHTAGHILDQAVKNVIPGIFGVDGDHGIGKRCSVDFNQVIDASLLPQIQTALDEIVAANLSITTEMVTKDELVKRKVHLPFDLPENKPLRIVQIGNYPAMPDGGTQLKSTGESWPITVGEVREKEGKWRVTYYVRNDKEVSAESKQEKISEVKTNQNSKTVEDIKKEIEKIKQQFDSDFERISNAEEFRIKYWGKKGVFVNTILKSLKEVTFDNKKESGHLVNEFLAYTINTFSSVGFDSKVELVDLTMPGIKPKVGHMHPISQAMEEITQIFERVGFTRVRYPEVDWDWYVFESLNMPPDHPARDEWETFFVDAPDDAKKGKMVMTTHTSNGQVREMERLKSKPPIRMINIGRCYRRQQDATHTQMFHQFEGLVVDKGITIQHLKGTLDYFAEQFYGPGTKSRIRPFHFRFTEPSFEVDFSCHICGGTGLKDGVKCKFCKSGWHEVGGAGMVHPNVLKAGGINPDEYTGFAFGWGVERTYTLKEGLNIDDIRLLFSGDLNFLEQF